MHLSTVLLAFCGIFVLMVVLNSSVFEGQSSRPATLQPKRDAGRSSPPLTPPEQQPTVSDSSAAAEPSRAVAVPPRRTAAASKTSAAPPPERRPPPVPRRYIVPIEADGGLSNQRSLMLFTLMTAVHWGVRDVLLSNVLLKLLNIQVFLPVSHRYDPPYENHALYIFSNAWPVRRLFKGWVCAGYAGTFGELFDEARFRAVAAEYNITVWHAPFGGYQEHEMNRVLPPPVKNVRFAEQRVVPFVGWKEFWADRDVLAQPKGAPHTPGAAASGVPQFTPFTPNVPVPAGRIDAALQRENFTLVKTSVRTSLMVKLELCFVSPLCLSLARAFEPSPLIVARFIEPLLALLPKTFIAVHYREYDCDRSARGIAQLLPHLAWHIENGRFPGITKVPTPIQNGTGTSTSTSSSSPVTLYMSTAVEAKEFWPLAQAGYTVVNKETLLGMTVLRYPFEVMAQVDFEICRRAAHFASLTVPLGTSGTVGSTYSAFVDIYRNLSGSTKMQYFGPCSSIAGKKKKH